MLNLWRAHGATASRCSRRGGCRSADPGSAEGLVTGSGDAIDPHKLVGAVHVEVHLAVRGCGQVTGVGLLEHEHVGSGHGDSV